MVPELHLDQVVLGHPCPSHLTFTVILLVLSREAVSELKIGIESQLPAGKLRVNLDRGR